MSDAGLPADAVGQHGAMPLHWAAFHGNVAMIDVLLKRSPSLTALDADFQGTPLGWAIHGSEHGWRRDTGDYAGAVTRLLRAGAALPAQISGSADVQRVLNAWPK